MVRRPRAISTSGQMKRVVLVLKETTGIWRLRISSSTARLFGRPRRRRNCSLVSNCSHRLWSGFCASNEAVAWFVGPVFFPGWMLLDGWI